MRPTCHSHAPAYFPLLLVAAACCPTEWPYQEPNTPDPLPAEVAYVLAHGVDLDVTATQIELGELPPDGVGDPLEQLAGCWGSYEQTVCGVECFYDCQMIYVYRFDKESGSVERQHYQPEISFLDILSGTYDIPSADRITLRWDTEVYFDGFAIVTRPWPLDPSDRSFLLIGDILVECHNVDSYEGRYFRRFDCP